MILPTLGKLMLCATAALILCQCTGSDPEYASRLATAKTSSKGNEVVGVWYTRIKARTAISNINSEMVLTLKPDGTGVRENKASGAALMSSVQDQPPQPVKWSHSGNGVWDFTVGTGMSTGRGTMRITGDRLLVETKFSTGGFGNVTNQAVYVNAKDATAVQDAKLRDSRVQFNN